MKVILWMGMSVNGIIARENNEEDFISHDCWLASSPHEALEKLNGEGSKGAVLTGGSSLNSSFAKSNLINEVILNIEPVIIGKGIPVFKPDVFDLKLELSEMKKSRGKTIQLKFRVIK